ncbi:hypothetical protein QFZ49_004413 [Streptomyces turgidiscabies]|uniref:MarR family transcriptional regulator n=1 Tax=Streptomyces turgidiscabies TaxID=85558 RepID=A0ABU0RRU1_9ACTN|nr:hypothetical protein [Streptomyces turgidiscabies]
MAEANFSAAVLPAHVSPPHPMANPGYGKRDAPDQRPRTNHDFAHLPPREAAVAAYIDRLPSGADISVKTLAKHLPYGQCALRTALNNLRQAGHLRRGREHLTGTGSQLWITRTWFTRTARGDDWWAAFTRGDVPQEQPGEGAEAEEPHRRPTRSRAFIPARRPRPYRPRAVPLPGGLRGAGPAGRGVVRARGERGVRTAHPDRRPADPGPPPGRADPQAPDRQTPAGARCRTATAADAGVREVRGAGAGGGAGGGRVRGVPGRGPAPSDLAPARVRDPLPRGRHPRRDVPATRGKPYVTRSRPCCAMTDRSERRHV